jgi:apolipoprotein N-acyltransferase
MWGFIAAPFVWVFTEFLRYWVTGNDWNAVGYSLACEPSCALPAFWFFPGLWTAAIGGVLLTSGVIVFANVMIVRTLDNLAAWGEFGRNVKRCIVEWTMLFVLSLAASFAHVSSMKYESPDGAGGAIVTIQPNVPMSGLDSGKLHQLRQRQVDLAEGEIKKILDYRKEHNERRIAKGLEQSTENERRITVVLPESPMDFMYSDDREFQQFIGDFARKNNVSVLFNSAEPNRGTTKYFNSAVMVGPDGNKIAEYDKIYLLPFGEYVPGPLESIVPAFVGNFARGSNYALLPIGDAKVGVMICFESHFGQLSREYVRMVRMR